MSDYRVAVRVYNTETHEAANDTIDLCKWDVFESDDTGGYLMDMVRDLAGDVA